MTYHIFIGYDEREHIPFLVAKHTLEKYTKVPIKVHKLCHRELRQKGLFTREWKIEGNGQYVDLKDGKPFSTQFSHTRFLIGELWKQIHDSDKSPLVMFVDCDFIWTDDIGKMFKEIEEQEPRKALYCVKHDYRPTNETKMDGMLQQQYNRKLWSAMFVLNMDYEVNKDWDFLYMVNTETGRAMHNFDWLYEEEIGSISESWHFVADHSEQRLPLSFCKALHYTNGGPWFSHMRDCNHAEMWIAEYEDFLRSSMYNTRFDVSKLLDGDL